MLLVRPERMLEQVKVADDTIIGAPSKKGEGLARFQDELEQARNSGALWYPEKWVRWFGQFFLGINKVTALRFQAATAAPVLLK
jgi:hypothetical protein